VKANRVQADFRFSKRSILRFLNGLSIGLGNPSRLTIAAGLILFSCQSPVNAQLTILHNFGDGTVANDGAHPRAGLVQAPSGNFFGSTLNQATAPSTFVGTIFKMSRSGVLQIIQSFDPTSGLYTTQPLLYHHGTVIGVTPSGPALTGPAGTVFILRHSATTGTWNLSFWHNFTGGAPDYDSLPAGNVILGSDGHFYGTTEGGGGAPPLAFDGAVYKLAPKTHAFTNVYGFSISGNFQPHAALVQGTDGNFYGSTYYTPGNSSPTQFGAFFKLTPAGQITFYPQTLKLAVEGPLIQASDANFYGMSGGEGLFGISSTPSVFSMTPSGVVTILHTFGQGSDGTFPWGTVVQGPNGNLYGTTSLGGTAGQGVLFEISTDGTSYTILHNFGDGSVANDGNSPTGTLIVGHDKNLYGTTQSGGSAGLGTVFKFTLTR
jgi:uncharacterized repeat protein (TIGR03803 family)